MDPEGWNSHVINEIEWNSEYKLPVGAENELEYVFVTIG